MATRKIHALVHMDLTTANHSGIRIVNPVCYDDGGDDVRKIQKKEFYRRQLPLLMKKD